MPNHLFLMSARILIRNLAPVLTSAPELSAEALSKVIGDTGPIVGLVRQESLAWVDYPTTQAAALAARWLAS